MKTTEGVKVTTVVEVAPEDAFEVFTRETGSLVAPRSALPRRQREAERDPIRAGGGGAPGRIG